MKNVQELVTETFKVQTNFLSGIMKNVFPITEAIYNHNLTNISNFTSRGINTVRYGSESSSYLGPRLWKILPDKNKKVQFIKDLKSKIKMWLPEKCPSWLWKRYIQHVGFL